METYGLTADDFKLLKEMARAHRQRPGNTRNLPDVPPELGTAPEVYFARAPYPFGIPALDFGLQTTGSGTGTVARDDVPGHADCFLFRLVGTNPVPLHVKKKLYNFSGAAIVAGTWVLAVRDKFGVWAANPTAVGGSGGGGDCLGPVQVVESTGTGTHGGWYVQEIYWDGAFWRISPGPVAYHSVVEINGMQPRMMDTGAMVLANQVVAATTLFKDNRGNYYIDYPRLSDSDTITFPSAVGCVSGVPAFTASTTVRICVDNFTNFPNIDVRTETV